MNIHTFKNTHYLCLSLSCLDRYRLRYILHIKYFSMPQCNALHWHCAIWQRHHQQLWQRSPIDSPTSIQTHLPNMDCRYMQKQFNMSISLAMYLVLGGGGGLVERCLRTLEREQKRHSCQSLRGGEGGILLS